MIRSHDGAQSCALEDYLYFVNSFIEGLLNPPIEGSLHSTSPFFGTSTLSSGTSTFSVPSGLCSIVKGGGQELAS